MKTNSPTPISDRRLAFYRECTPSGAAFTSEDKTSIPAIPLRGQPLTHGLVHLTAWFATGSDGTEHIHAFTINQAPLIPADQLEDYHAQAAAIAKTIDSLA